MAENIRIAGHALLREGLPYDDQGRYPLSSQGEKQQQGRAKCSCGALSPNLPSGAQRKAWHREHKAEVREQVVPGADESGA